MMNLKVDYLSIDDRSEDFVKYITPHLLRHFANLVVAQGDGERLPETLNVTLSKTEALAILNSSVAWDVDDLEIRLRLLTTFSVFLDLIPLNSSYFIVEYHRNTPDQLRRDSNEFIKSIYNPLLESSSTLTDAMDGFLRIIDSGGVLEKIGAVVHLMNPIKNETIRCIGKPLASDNLYTGFIGIISEFEL